MPGLVFDSHAESGKMSEIEKMNNCTILWSFESGHIFNFIGHVSIIDPKKDLKK